MNDLIENKKNKSIVTRQKIIDCYLDMILDTRWDKINVKDLCAKAEISRGTFYQYFDDIYNLMEQIEAPLLDDLNIRFEKKTKNPIHTISPELFEKKFDCTPPEPLRQWFDFCKKNKKPMSRLLDRKNGDSYFINKVKVILSEYINYMMDNDGMPHDPLRNHFLKMFIEMHFLSASTWFSSDEEEVLSIDDILNLLNTMRVGANYLSYKRSVSNDLGTDSTMQSNK